jgi:hypothetical protein
MVHMNILQQATHKPCLREYLQTSYNCVGPQVLTAVVMKGIIFWDVTPCSLVEVQ